MRRAKVASSERPVDAGSDMADLQGAVEADEYERGSPHLVHASLRNELIHLLRSLVLERLDRSGHCRVLEVGAGPGSFTDQVLSMGAEVVLTEMSLPSFSSLADRLRHNDRATVVYDPAGDQIFERSGDFDLVLCISVLHHIPDYTAFITRAVGSLHPGGALVSYQDPLFYSRRRRVSLAGERVAYLAWRVGQGGIRRGLATQIRRWRGVYDEHKPGDMVEYHVVRDGVDELAILDQLASRFESVSVKRYWSTQSRLLQSAGARLGGVNTFGVVARGRLK